MIKTKNLFSAVTLLTVMTLLMFTGGCKEEPNATPDTSYELKVKDVLGVKGTVTFTETSATTATITISLIGAPAGTHPAQLCMKSAVEGGVAAVILNPVDANGKSSTVVTDMTYDELIGYDGYIKVLKSETEPDVILAQGDIGGNALTGIKKNYVLTSLGSFAVTGNALFEKRENGSTLVTITLAGGVAGEVYPATINIGSVATVGGGPVTMLLNVVNGTTGLSYTNIRKLDSGLAISYDNWLVYDGYLNIYQTSVISGVVISHGNIGSN